MATHTYSANIKLGNGSPPKVTIEADNDGNAKRMLKHAEQKRKRQ